MTNIFSKLKQITFVLLFLILCNPVFGQVDSFTESVTINLTEDIVQNLDGVIVEEETKKVENKDRIFLVAKFDYVTQYLFRITTNQFVEDYSNVEFYDHWFKQVADDGEEYEACTIAVTEGDKAHIVYTSYFPDTEVAVFMLWYQNKIGSDTYTPKNEPVTEL